MPPPATCARRPAFAPTPTVIVPAFDVFSLFDKGRAEKLLTGRFQDIVARVEKTHGIPPGTVNALYGLYQQATQGDATGSGPGLFGNKKKWAEWVACAGLTNVDAMQKYIKIAMSFINSLEKSG